MSGESAPPAADRLVLVVRRRIAAEPRRLFEAWTRPEQLRAWWGPKSVRCSEAEVDLRVGGRYQIVNDLPDGSQIVISGTFEVVEAPRLLVYSWMVVPGGENLERVTVRFDPVHDALTEVVVTHERIGSPRLREGHRAGWDGCLDGLAAYLA
ncbi:MAG TPA: SRPBCC domain-containing protein [Polyangia bacterium]|jgi:uncharacterized protein YndB with AHSA1/START domain|nr:SRPBCC domain-containing protein [Polyangia bacterium]